MINMSLGDSGYTTRFLRAARRLFKYVPRDSSVDVYSLEPVQDIMTVTSELNAKERKRLLTAAIGLVTIGLVAGVQHAEGMPNGGLGDKLVKYFEDQARELPVDTESPGYK